MLWRAVSISALDFRKPESYVLVERLVERLMEEAEMMRESTGEGV
ncbi:MAG: hypothetical protein QME77_14185 [bacterium]|nr:hypothetical protein [bacterium]